jgi:hypothetical protein
MKIKVTELTTSDLTCQEQTVYDKPKPGSDTPRERFCQRVATIRIGNRFFCRQHAAPRVMRAVISQKIEIEV